MKAAPTAFEKFELEQSLFDLQVREVPVWERIRFEVFQEIRRQNGTGRAHTAVGNDWRDYARGTSLLLRNLVIKNPYFSEESDLLFVGHHRRKQLDDGYWWDIYCDPIHEAGSYDFTHFEKDHMLSHASPPRTANLRYLDLIEQVSNIQRVLKINSPVIPPKTKDTLERARKALLSRFDADIDLVAKVKKVLHERRAKLPLYKRLVKRVDPELVVVVVSYGRETLIEACKSQDVPVAELQHGVVSKHHFGYSFPGPRTKTTFPDYFLAFGDFWKQSVDFPVPESHVIPVGYPFLEQSIGKYSDAEATDKLIFISQGTVGRTLSKFAVELNQHPNADYDIIYKLHPGEYDRWRTEYPWLETTELEVVEDGKNLYRLFSEASAQIGVGSTAIYEGLAFDLQTFIYDCPDAEVMEPLVDENAATKISTTDELASSLGTASPQFDQSYYFESNSVEKACEVFDDLRK
ncbi:hypothetical protein [Halobacterium jilantaiense]|uniref:CDP-Glycerol:Poly(Glycerophosphate) glycerophosphotransferase n=1 Tax=Halobacterium jilantaiense TaxID=355548 RepID=A0A1I0MSA8_9EURY|nr:hypothetical protein [Halobacterium jilantaiense]SEV91592.1 hypothetical protein SAMN04487945_0334 [Halobacterium jilantaiense]